MTLRQLKRKYLIEGAKIGYRKALKEAKAPSIKSLIVKLIRRNVGVRPDEVEESEINEVWANIQDDLIAEIKKQGVESFSDLFVGPNEMPLSDQVSDILFEVCYNTGIEPGDFTAEDVYDMANAAFKRARIA